MRVCYVFLQTVEESDGLVVPLEKEKEVQM